MSLTLNGLRSSPSAAHPIFNFMKVSNPFRYKFRGEYPNEPSVYKIWVDDKFMIWKGKNLHHSVGFVSKDIDTKLRSGVKDGSHMRRLIEEIIASRVLWIEVELISQHQDPALLLKAEFDALQQEKDNPNCLNVIWEPHLPKWISEEDVTRFKKLCIIQS